MAKRTRLTDPAPETATETGGLYFDDEADPTEFIRSGSTLLDLILGGGWALGRVSNIYGDSATGKSLLALEACANFAQQFPDGKIFYREVEEAFNEDYARALGAPLDRIDFGDTQLETVEDLFDDLGDQTKELIKGDCPGLYIVDSLDALTSDEEMKLKDVRGSASIANKARGLSQMFRNKIRDVGKSRTHLMFVSQIRTKIGVTYGRKTERSGGRALRFYASQIIFLRQLEMITPTVKGVKRPTGIYVSAKNEKSRIGMPFREVEFPILFRYGIDNLRANIEWLGEVGEVERLGITVPSKAKTVPPEAISKFIKDTHALPDSDYAKRLKMVNATVRTVWNEIEEETRERHLPPRVKYS